jgi:hypothetical protein
MLIYITTFPSHAFQKFSSGAPQTSQSVFITLGGLVVIVLAIGTKVRGFKAI